MGFCNLSSHFLVPVLINVRYNECWMVGNRGGELFSFNWLENVECVLLTVTYGFVNGKGITPYFGIMSEWGSADLAVRMKYVKDGQESSVFFLGKKRSGRSDAGSGYTALFYNFRAKFWDTLHKFHVFSGHDCILVWLPLVAYPSLLIRDLLLLFHNNLTKRNIVIVTVLGFVLHFSSSCRTEPSVLVMV